jgi:hypothetical protein
MGSGMMATRSNLDDEVGKEGREHSVDTQKYKSKLNLRGGVLWRDDSIDDAGVKESLWQICLFVRITLKWSKYTFVRKEDLLLLFRRGFDASCF